MRRRRLAIGNPYSTCCGATCPHAGLSSRLRAGRANTSRTLLNRAGLILFSNRATQIPVPAPSIDAWAAALGLGNIRPAIGLDAKSERWPISYADAMLCINLIHIAPWLATVGLMRGAADILPIGGVLFLYGPFRRNGCHTALSNEAFDRDLRMRNPAWGVRDLEAVAALAEAHGFAQPAVEEMPANNLSLIFLRQLP
jgi:hypothetical protein